MPTHPCLAYCTCPDRDCAEQIATRLIEQSLAACVTLLPGAKSFYRWEGRLCQDEEILLIIKTTEARLVELESCIRQTHPYEVPEFIVTPVITGSEPYLNWIHTCTAST